MALTGVAIAQESCILTEKSCQCSKSTPTGTCLRSQGDGTCLLGLCSEGYRCDCLGYEICDLTTCGKHVPIGSGAMSDTKPFKCRMELDAGTCLNAAGFVDTLSGANNAAADAFVSREEASVHEATSLTELGEIMAEKKTVNEMLMELDRVAIDIPDEELEEIEAAAVAVFEAVKKSAVILGRSIEHAKKTTDKSQETRRYRLDTEKKERQIKEKVDILKNLQEKNGKGLGKDGEGKERNGPKGSSPNKEDEKTIQRLEVEISSLIAERQKSATMCGVTAKEAKDLKSKASNESSIASRTKEDAREASAKCMQKANKAISNARSKYKA